MSTMSNSLPPTSPSAGQPWYREPYVWLVLGGPLVVVVASVITYYIAAQGADPVLDRSRPAVRAVAAEADSQTPEGRLAAEKALLPAGQGRNHAVSPELPKP